MSNNISLTINSKKINESQLDISTGKFNFAIGVKGETPSPLEYLLAGLASCVNAVAHVVAKEQNIEFGNLEISITGHDLNTARFLGQDTSSRAGFREISVDFNVESEESQETIDKWLAAVEDRCPAADIILNATPIRVKANKLALVS